MIDNINHPAHYTQINGLECIDVAEQFGYNRGNAIKYLWRAGVKSKETKVEDLKKARWYVNREIGGIKDQQKRIYVASPYTKGDKIENVRASLRAGDEILRMGHIPFLPLLSHFWEAESPKPYETWLEIDLVWLRACDAVVRLPGESSGADGEVAEAKRYEIPVYYGLDELREEIEAERFKV